jgi:hypothetical protein
MADNDDAGEMFGAIIGGLVMLMLIVAAVAAVVAALMSAGALYGAWTALVNYGLSLRESIRPERAAA